MEQERKQLELLKKMKESKQNQGRKRTRSEALNDIEVTVDQCETSQLKVRVRWPISADEQYS